MRSAALVSLCVLLCAACTVTRPSAAYVRADGVRVGVSRQSVVLSVRNETDAIRAAMDTAGIAVVDSVATKRRPRPFGTTYITTVTGHGK